jgi:hypothetical protein
VASALSCADLHLVPAPRECKAVESVPIGGVGFFIQADNGSEDSFATQDLVEESLGKRTVQKDAPFIHLKRAESEAAQALLNKNNLTFDPAMHDEGYIIVPDGEGGLAVIAETSAGIFYGAQTVKQLIRGSGKEAVLLLPTLRDWPAMAHRGVSDDWSRGPLPNMDFLKREIRTLAAFKINILSPRFENSFAYAASPVAAFPGGAMTPGEARELVDYAAQYHITILPEQETFGPLRQLLSYEQFSPLGETAHGAAFDPSNAGTLPLIARWFSELASVFPGPYAHIGAGEAAGPKLGKSGEPLTQQELGTAYLDFLQRIHTAVAPDNKRLLFWGDVAVNSPELVEKLPKDMIAVARAYDAQSDFKPLIELFTKAGLETWVAPSVSNGDRLYPDNQVALDNIRAFVRDGKQLGATGVLNTLSNDDGESLFDENWFGVLFGAAAGWQAGEGPADGFTDSFGLAFHGDTTGKISQAQRELMAAHDAFKQAGLVDAQDSYFWTDPFSPEGQRLAGKLRPIVSQLRLHAERAITLIAEARAADKLENQEALDAMELGARRIDFVGLKMQDADDSATIYAQAQALAADPSRSSEVEELLTEIGSEDGRLKEIRNGYALLGGVYRQAWLRDNRPYWLEINQARYDRAVQLWMDRAERWNLLVEQWRDTHTLPSAAEAGLPAPVEKPKLPSGTQPKEPPSSHSPFFWRKNAKP